MLNSYKWFFSRMQQLPAEDRRSPSVGVLGASLTYFVQGLVSGPEEMSATRSMLKDLDIIGRARRYGFASIPPERLASDMMRLAGHITIERYPIFKYIARKNPAGVRLKHSNLAAGKVSSSEGAQETQKSVFSCGPAIVYAHYESHHSGSWSEEDRKWTEGLVNSTLAEWLWSRLSEQDQQPNISRSTRSGPLRLTKWQHVVDVGVGHGFRSSAAGFDNVCQKLFPPNWVLQEMGVCWGTLQLVVLDQILDRIEGVESDRRVEYSTQIRKAISEVMRTWEFLPCVQKHKIWSYEGSGRRRKYMLYKNPNPTRA